MNLDMHKRSSLREKLIEILEENDATTMTNFRSNFEGTIAQLVGDVLKQNPITNEQLSNVTAFESSKYEEGENITNTPVEQSKKKYKTFAELDQEKGNQNVNEYTYQDPYQNRGKKKWD